MPSGEMMFLGPSSHSFDLFIPTATDHQGAQLQHFFGMMLSPEDAVSFQPQVDDSADTAFNGTASQGETAATKFGVVQSSRFPGQFNELRPLFRSRRILLSLFVLHFHARLT